MPIDKVVQQIDSSPAPAGVDPQLYQQLKAELIRAVRSAHGDHVVSAPPAGEGNTVDDLALVGSDSSGYQLEWTMVNAGDYDRNGEVNISDLATLGRHFGTYAGGPYWDEGRMADGDGNGEVNISDITPIGLHFMTQFTAYEVFTAPSAADYPQPPEGDNGPGASSLGVVQLDSGVEDRQRRLRFSFPLASADQAYWVRPVTGGEQGSASNLLDLAVQLKPETVVLDGSTAAALTNYEGGTLTFSSMTTQLGEVSPGSILVSGPLPAAPSGLLVRVDSVSGGGPVQVDVTPADLRDALARCSFTAYIPLEVANVKSASSAVPGLSWDPAKTPSGALGAPFFLPFDDIPMGSNVTLSGNVLLWPSLILEFELGPTVVEELSFGASCHVSSGITVNGGASGTWDKELTLFTWEFLPIVFSLAGFPIVIEPSIDLVLGANGDCTLEFTASATADAYLEGKIGYDEGSFGFHKDYSGLFATPDPVIYGALNSENYAGARLNLLLYGAVGGFGTLAAGLRANADVTADPWWTVCAFVKGDVGVDLLLLEEHYDLFDECLWTRNAGGPFVPPPPNSSWGRALDHAVTADYDVFYAVLPLADGGVIAAGSSYLHPVIARFDSQGTLVWQKYYSEPGWIHDLTQASDGAIIGVGEHIENSLVMKVSQDGQLLWARKVAGPRYDGFYAVEPLANGGYLAVGDLILQDSFADGLVVALNDDGTVASSHSYGHSAADQLNALTRNPDGSFYASGSYSNHADAWLAQIDATGQPAWHKLMHITGIQPGDFSEWSTGVAADGAGGCYFTGQTSRGGLTMWLVRYSPQGHGWARLIDHEDFALTWDVTDLIGLRDGGAAICGQTGTAGPEGQRDGFVVSFSPGGGLSWAAAYGGSADDGNFALCERLGGAGLFVGGLSQSFRTDNEQDAWVLLLRPGGTVSFTPASGAGRSYMSGNVLDDEDISEHYTGVTPPTATVPMTSEDLGGSFSDYGATPIEL